MNYHFNLLEVKYPKRRFWLGIFCFVVLGVFLISDYKPKLFKDEDVLNWEEISFLKDYSNRIFLVRKNSKSYQIDLCHLEQEHAMRIRSTLQLWLKRRA